MKANIECIVGLGFEYVGDWLLSNNSLHYSLSRYTEERDTLYAFVSGREIKYIGRSAVTLTQRLNGYRMPGPTQKTNIRIRYLIIELLKKGMSVTIYAFVQRHRLLYKGFPVNLAAGLENALIKHFKPEWNMIGK